MKLKMILALGCVVASSPLAAQTATLTNGSGDGQLSIALSGTGYASPTTGTYNPVGDGTAATTVFESNVYARVGNSGARSAFSDGTVTSFTSTATTAVSAFTLGALSIGLNQSLTNLTNMSGTQTGTLLTQTYSITNTMADAISLNLVRYFDGDLEFDGSLVDGGGFLTTAAGTPLLFEIDSATGASTAATFVGLYNIGGTLNGYEIDSYPGLRSRIAAGQALDGIITGDGNGDGFIDSGNGYDVTLGLGALLNIGGNSTGTFSTYTIFGTGAPGSVVIPTDPTPTPGVPEPATWIMMMIGFGLAGGALRRRRQQPVRVIA